MKPQSPLGFPEAAKAARFIARRWHRAPQVGIVLGSGLGGLARRLADPRRISFRDIPRFPVPTAEGHSGTLHWGEWKGVPAAILEGRVHLYEGRRPDEVAFPVRVLAEAGVRTFILTCAAGGIAPRATPGSFMVFSDHLNFQGLNVLAGAREWRSCPRFPDMSQAYDVRLRALARQAAKSAGVRWFEGVYAAVLGPSYETPAEIRALRRLGADAVGMSTVPEVLALRALGVPVLALASITNRAAGLARPGGLGKRPLTHDEVLREGTRSARDLERWLDDLLPRIAKSQGE